MKPYNILLAGVGGQGLMLLSQVIGDACTRNNIKVVVGAQHGLSQRSGSISAHVRVGDASSPLIPYSSANLIISMEAMEALRNIEYLKEGGTVIMSQRLIHPPLETAPLVKSRNVKGGYATLDQVKQALSKVAGVVIDLDSSKLALEAGNPRTENVVLLGAACSLSGFPVTAEELKESIRRIVPERAVDANFKAFELGQNSVKMVK